ncbi:MAG: hypothetical protein AAF443_04245 [Chlamydiota bacterium]
MHFALASEHLDFFHAHQYVEFDSLITESEATALAEATKQITTTRLHHAHQSLPQASLEALFLAGRDHWREHQAIKKIVLRPQLANIAAQLSKQNNLRIAYDQVLLTALPTAAVPGESHYPSLFSPTTLDASSCIQGIAAALILQLSPVDSSLMIADELAPFTLLPQNKGNGLFFKPTLPFSLAYLRAAHQPIHQLLIVYGSKKSMYKREDRDPHTHKLKKFGYTFGDRLTQATHPILTRI